MKLDRSKTAVIVVVILTVVCAGSFFAVRSINKRTKAPAVTISSFASTAAPVTQDPAITDTAPLEPDSVQSDDTISSDLFTTFETPDADTSATVATELPTAANLLTTQMAQTVPTEAEEQPQEVISRAAVFSNGFLGFQYNKDGQYYFTTADPWQRNFGFNELFDIGAAFVNFYYDTVRCKFTYQNMDWLIQLWKGQYGFVFVGAEIGCYYKPTDRSVKHYDCVSDEDALYMSMSFYRKGEERATREYAKYWWCTAFIPGTLDSFRDRSELAMKARITMKDKEMRRLFCASLEKNGFKRDETYSVSGLDVYISWA